MNSPLSQKRNSQKLFESSYASLILESSVPWAIADHRVGEREPGNH